MLEFKFIKGVLDVIAADAVKYSSLADYTMFLVNLGVKIDHLIMDYTAITPSEMIGVGQAILFGYGHCNVTICFVC